MREDELLFDPDFFDPEQDNLKQKQKFELREGELREVTVLFADVKGFTNLSTRFDPEVVHNRMDELMKVFSRCVTFYGGFVDKYIGDSIMALFGAKKTTEHDTERAIRAGLKMLQQLQLYNAYLRKQPGYEEVDLAVRIGINTGLVSVGKVGESREGDFTVYGPEVNLASRMESNAPVGGIMVPHSTMRLVEHVFEFVHLGLKQVKGLDEPVDCWQPLRVIADGSQRKQSYTASFIGREDAMAWLETALDKVLEADSFTTRTAELPPPRPVIAGIKADAGIGKTRLLYEFRRANESKALFVNAFCNGVSPTPLNLFANLFEHYFCVRISEPIAEKEPHLRDAYTRLEQSVCNDTAHLLRDAYPLVAFLLEIKSDDPRLKQDGKDLLQHLMQAVDTVLAAILECAGNNGTPTVFVLDDLHWLDSSSSAALELIINRFSRREQPSLWVLMYRPDWVVPGFVQRMRGFAEYELSPLLERDIEQLVIQRTGGLDLPEDTLDKVVQLSAGNPFCLEEWCNYSSQLPRDGIHDLPVPANLNTLILSRLDRLPAELKLMLQKAAVIGPEFLVDILKQVEASLSEALDVDATLASLEQYSLISKVLGFEFPSYFFKHITTREVAYQTLLVANRKVLHQITAEAIEKVFADRLEEFLYALAEHYLRADIRDKAAVYLEKAADASARIFNNTQAIGFYEQLLALVPYDDASRRGKLLSRMADVQWLNGDMKGLIATLEQLSACGEISREPDICFHYMRIHGLMAFMQGDFDTALSEWQGCLAAAIAARDDMMQCVAYNLLGIWHQERKDYPVALEYHNYSRELAEKLDAPSRLAKTLNNLGRLHLSQEEFSQAEDLFSQSLAIASQHRYMQDESLAAGNLGWAKILQKQYDAALPYLERKLVLAEKMNDKLEIIKALGNMATAYIETNRPQESVQCYERIVRIKEYMGDCAGAEKSRSMLATIRARINGGPTGEKTG